MSDAPILWFEELGIDDTPRVGGKNASLGEMRRALAPLGVRQANGFAVTADAFRSALTAAGAWSALHAALDGLDKTDLAALREAGRACRDAVYDAGLTPQTEAALVEAYDRLKAESGAEGFSVAVRSSATAEDLPTASFAGQHDTYLNVRGHAMLIDAVKRCQASLFTDRAISYRIDKGFDHFKVALSTCVMRMIRSDLGASGVMFSIDTETGHPDFVFITGAWGLGETVVQGSVDPDEFLVHKPTYRAGARAVTRRGLGRKQIKMVYAEGRTREPIITVPTDDAEAGRFCISDAQVLELADFSMKIEDHYTRVRGVATPMDMEWALDGLDGKLYVVQARPETVASQRVATVMEEFVIEPGGDPIVSGRAVGAGCATGAARVIRDAAELSAFTPGEILVADSTSPDWEPVMKTAGAIVTNRGGRTCHAAIVARELGVPAVVGAAGATEALAKAGAVTVSCAEGETGRVYEGAVPFRVERTDLGALPTPRTEIMVNLGNPELALQTSRLPVSGVGLARLEFIIGEHVKAHPMALLHPERVADPAARAALAAMTAGHASGADYFVERLSEGVGVIAAAFWPRPVIVRMSDFKSNEYASLVGGAAFEAPEENPMIGFRGASRYAHPAYQEGFALECAAMRRVRETMGLTNLKLMLPFVRRLEEADRVLEVMARNGLARGENGLEIYVMCEIPNNILLIDAFAKRFDGFSIGSNDLTQLTLGVDRDSELVAFDFDERDPGVLAFLRQAVEGARRNGRHVGICGQAPSDYPEVARYLVEIGIESMSLTPDSVLGALREVIAIEAATARKPG